MLGGISLRQFLIDLKKEISEDNLSNGAAALAYFLTLALFPAMILILSLVPYLPIQNVDQAIMDFLRQALPGDSAAMFTGVIEEVTDKKGGLLSFGILATLWAASTGMLAVMQQLNITYDVKEARSFVKARATALGLTLLFGALLLSAFLLIVLGGKIEGWLASAMGSSGAIVTLFAAFRWVVILAAMLLAFSVAYRFGPNVERKFRFVSVGSALGVLVLIGATLGFRYYVANFGNYSATYGSIGAVIIFELWLYIAGFVLLLGSEIDALVERYRDQGEQKAGKVEKAAA